MSDELVIVRDEVQPTPDVPAVGGDPDRALIKAVAMDIGKEVVAHIEVMYPKAITACSSTFKLSVRNCVYNEIMAALDVTDEGKIIARLDERKKFRRWWTGTYRKLRRKEPLPLPPEETP